MDNVVYGVFRQYYEWETFCECCGPEPILETEELVALYESFNEAYARNEAEDSKGEFNHEVKRLEVK